MTSTELAGTGRIISRLAYGCWRIAPDAEFAGTRGRAAVLAAYEAGYTLFDHADIYGNGRAEEIFGKVLRGVGGMRERVLIATKCGVRKAGDPTGNAPHRYDLSREHILRSCEESLRRLGVDQIDLYQLHRPDWLMDPGEIAAAFEELRAAGKVAEFGVSNFTPTQVSTLQRACPMQLRVNQVEISLARQAPFIDGTLEHCLAEKMTPLAWSPLAGGLLAEGANRVLPSQTAYRTTDILRVIDRIGTANGLSRSEIALAWLLRHPAGIVPIIGSVQPDRIWSAVAATQCELAREDWYRILEAARGECLP
ncbi:MAG: aldo/keto reductase [Verrucomicrobiae bacterium]|nr:aldo/keto reductase [Verrucomicrobiae bacterium]